MKAGPSRKRIDVRQRPDPETDGPASGLTGPNFRELDGGGALSVRDGRSSKVNRPLWRVPGRRRLPIRRSCGEGLVAEKTGVPSDTSLI